jgi:hypothetical protein
MTAKRKVLILEEPARTNRRGRSRVLQQGGQELIDRSRSRLPHTGSKSGVQRRVSLLESCFPVHRPTEAIVGERLARSLKRCLRGEGDAKTVLAA